MAITSAALAAHETAGFAADKPLLIGGNKLTSTTVTAHEWSAAGSFAGADATSINAAGSNPAYDNHEHRLTYPNGSAATWYYLIDMATSMSNFDACALIGFDADSSTWTISIEADTGSTFGTAITLETRTGITGTHATFLSMFHTGSVPLRYAGVDYLRIVFTRTAGDGIPKFGEFICGRRRQLKHQPKIPWDFSNYATRSGVFRSAGGVQVQYDEHIGQRRIVANLATQADPYASDLQSFLETDTSFATKPFLWIDLPSSAQDSAYWMRFDNPGMSAPQVGPLERAWVIAGNEIGPGFVKRV